MSSCDCFTLLTKMSASALGVLVRRFRAEFIPVGARFSFPSWLSWVASLEGGSHCEPNGNQRQPRGHPLGEAGGPEEAGVHLCTLCCFSCVLLSPHEKPAAGWLPGSRSSGDLHNELTPRPCDSRAGHFKELCSVPCFPFLFLCLIFNTQSQKEGGREGRRTGGKELSHSNQSVKRRKWSGSEHK